MLSRKRPIARSETSRAKKAPRVQTKHGERSSDSTTGRLPELPGEVWGLILQRVGRCSELQGARLASKQLCSVVDSHTEELRLRLTPDSSRFWRARGLLKWPSCTSVTLVWDALEIRYADVGKLLSQPFARVPLEVRRRVGELAVEAKYYGDSDVSDVDSDDEPSCLANHTPKPIETFDANTMQLPAKPLAALLRLLPGLHTVRLPPSTPFENPEVNLVVFSALSTLQDLRHLALPSFSFADGLGALSGLQRLTRLTVQSLNDCDVGGNDFDLDLEDQLTPAGVQGLCMLKGLKHLELRSVTTLQVFDTEVRQMLDSLPSLERLVVRGLATQMVDELDEDVEADEDDERASMRARFQLNLALGGGHITSIALAYQESKYSRSSGDTVSLGLVSYLARTLLLPRVAPAPAPRVKALRLRCAVTLGLTDGWGEWLEPLRELVERCEAVEVQGLDVTPREAMRRVAAAEVEALILLFGKPQRLRLGEMGVYEYLGLRRRQEPPALECQPGMGCPARVPAMAAPYQQQLAQAAQAVWDNRAGGTELQRLRSMMNTAGLSSGPDADRGWEYSDRSHFIIGSLWTNDSDSDSDAD